MFVLLRKNITAPFRFRYVRHQSWGTRFVKSYVTSTGFLLSLDGALTITDGSTPSGEVSSR